MKFTKQEIRNLKKLCDAVSKVKDKPLTEEDDFDMQIKQLLSKTPGKWKSTGRYKNEYNYVGYFTKSELQRLGASSYDIETIFSDDDDDASYDAYIDVADDVLDALNRTLKSIGGKAVFNSDEIDDTTFASLANIGFAIYKR